MLFLWTSQPEKTESKAYKGSKGILIPPCQSCGQDKHLHKYGEGRWGAGHGSFVCSPSLGKRESRSHGPWKTFSPLGRNKRGTQHAASSKVRTLSSSLGSQSEEHRNRKIQQFQAPTHHACYHIPGLPACYPIHTHAIFWATFIVRKPMTIQPRLVCICIGRQNAKN